MQYIKNLLSVIFSLFGFIKCSSESICETNRDRYTSAYYSLYGSFILQTIYFYQDVSIKYSQWWIPDLNFKTISTKTSVYKSDVINPDHNSSLCNRVYLRFKHLSVIWAIIPFKLTQIIIKGHQNDLTENALIAWCAGCSKGGPEGWYRKDRRL